MPSSDQFACKLHETNRRLGFWLSSLLPSDAHPKAQAITATPEQITGLLSELMHAGEWLRSLPADSGDAIKQELSEYRKQVEQLRALLPTIHSALLRERARLEQQRDRLKSASEWARASRQTL